MFTNNHMVEYEIIEMFSSMIEDKDTYTAGHSKRVAYYSAQIAKELSLCENEQNAAYQAGLLHDIGKLLTPESILLKPRKLTKDEYKIIQNHSIDGEKMVSYLSPFKHYMPIIRHHHERYDGYGYPDQLKEDEIPLIARILCVADAFDAMTTNRIYKSRKNNQDALDELKKNSRKQFDPLIVKAAINFFETSQELMHIHQLPHSTIDEERFAYFYKDKITGAYSSEYLNYFLSHNLEKEDIASCYLIQTRFTQEYNAHYGWKSGNLLLKEIVTRLKTLFKNTLIFRVFGDDFVVLKKQPFLSYNIQEIEEKLSVGLHPVKVNLTCFSPSKITFKKWEDFEPYLNKYNNNKRSKK